MALTQVQGGMILASGQSIPKAALPTGSVLQVVFAEYAVETGNATDTYADTGLTVSITPTSSSSKILVLASMNGVYKETGNTATKLRLVRGATVISNFATYAAGTNNTNTNSVSASTSYLDSPATTSSTTYKVQFASNNNIAWAYVQVNQSVSMITLLEIAA